MDKLARHLRDHFNIHYTGALEIKRKIFAMPDFDARFTKAKQQGQSLKEFVTVLAKPLVDELYETE